MELEHLVHVPRVIVPVMHISASFKFLSDRALVLADVNSTLEGPLAQLVINNAISI